jgi:hypothetical protein
MNSAIHHSDTEYTEKIFEQEVTEEAEIVINVQFSVLSIFSCSRNSVLSVSLW